MLSSLPSSNDFLLGFHLSTAAVQGRFLRLDKTLNTILHYHSYPKIVTQLLTETLNIACLLIAQLKTQSRVTLQIKGKGLIRLLIVDINNDGDVRGYADYDPILDTSDCFYSFTDLVASTDKATSAGTLVVTFDEENSKQLSQGVVALQGSSLTESMMHYFQQSVQQDVCLLIQTHQDDQNQWCSAALFLQKNAIVDVKEAEQWAYSKLLVQTIQEKELLDFNRNAHDILINIFHEQEIYFQPCKAIKAQCRCSREKIQQFVDQWSEQEKNGLKEKGQLEVRCEFCNTLYTFT